MTADERALGRTITMRSAEGVELELPIASPAPRMLAYAIDAAFIWTVMLGGLTFVMLSLPLADWLADKLGGVGDALASGSSDRALSLLAPVLAIAQLVLTFHEFLYFTAWELLARGRTPGKYFVGLRVVGADGQPVSATPVLVRNALRLVDVLPGAYTFGLVSMVASRGGQRLGDRAGGTFVIRADVLPRVSEVPLPPELTPLPLSREQLAGLGAREVALVSATLRRIQGMRGGEREQLLQEVAGALSKRLGLPPTDPPNPLRLLQQLLLTAQSRR